MNRRRSPLKRFLLRSRAVRAYGIRRHLRDRASRLAVDNAYVASVLSLVGLMTIQWAGIERMIDELIAHYQHSHTDLKGRHPFALKDKVKYLRRMGVDHRLSELTRRWVSNAADEIERLSLQRHELIHGVLHRPGAQRFSRDWRVQRVKIMGAEARVETTDLAPDAIAELVKSMQVLSQDLGVKIWALTRGLEGAISQNQVRAAMVELGLHASA